MSGIRCLTDRHIPPRRRFPIDAIGIWVLTGKSMEEWLNTIESKLSIVMNQGFLGLVGFITVGGGPQFFGFWMPLMGW